MKIALNAKEDLFVAGHDNSVDAISDFESAYEQAANALGKSAGIEIDIVSTSHETRPADIDEDPHDIWQSIHDCLYQDDSGEWFFDPETARIKGQNLYKFFHDDEE